MQILILWVWMCHFCGLMFCFSCSTYLFFLSLLSLHARGCRVAGATATAHATNAAIFIFRTSSMRSPNDWGNFIKRIFCSATCYAHIRSRSYVVCKQLEQTSGWQDIQVTALDSEIGQFVLAVTLCCEILEIRKTHVTIKGSSQKKDWFYERGNEKDRKWLIFALFIITRRLKGLLTKNCRTAQKKTRPHTKNKQKKQSTSHILKKGQWQ